jgi:hypothetical protein
VWLDACHRLFYNYCQVECHTKIGSIYKNQETGAYEICLLPDGLGGPYDTAAEYYRTWSARQKDTCPRITTDDVSRIGELASAMSKHDTGPFRLTHPDFGHQYIIVNDDFDILACCH